MNSFQIAFEAEGPVAIFAQHDPGCHGREYDKSATEGLCRAWRRTAEEETYP